MSVCERNSPPPSLLYPAVGFLLANAVVSGSPTSQSRRGNRPTIMDVRAVPIYCAILRVSMVVMTTTYSEHNVHLH